MDQMPTGQGLDLVSAEGNGAGELVVAVDPDAGERERNRGKSN